MSKQKKIMLLGGLRYVIPLIAAAHKHGYYVITADYLPNNVAHQYADEYVNVSIIDKEAVLKVAREKQIDGILSFAVDPGVIAAAYVQEQMHLPSMGPFKSVNILQHKDLFRKLLETNGFNVPFSKGFTDKKTAIKDCIMMIEECSWSFPIIVKPTDSAGSKGVTRVDRLGELEAAIDEAFDKSIGGTIIIEQFLEKVGCSSDTDSFLLNGKLVYVTFNAQRFDVASANPYTPSAYTWPSTFTQEQEAYLTAELQRLMDLLHMQTSVFNIETRIATDGKPYIMEVSPRGGGNRLCEMIRYATGVDLIDAQVCAAVGDNMDASFHHSIYPSLCKSPNAIYNGHWAEIILHPNDKGVFDHLEIAEDMRKYIVDEDPWVVRGYRVDGFSGANDAIGTLKMHFDLADQMEYAVTHQDEWLKVVVK